jgi:hypothetical protein
MRDGVDQRRYLPLVSVVPRCCRARVHLVEVEHDVLIGRCSSSYL